MWVVVLPVKPFSRAKSRLAAAGFGPWRHELAHAFFLDTLRAVRATESVRAVVVVTDDPLAASQARTMDAVVCPDEPGIGLNGAVRLGAGRAAALVPGAPVAVLTADLPALRPEELGRALAEARGHRRAFVADHTGEGTTLLTARRASALAPSFGAGSRYRHVRGGAFHVETPAGSGLRLDVDTPDDLAAAVLRGAGPYTKALFSLHHAMAAPDGGDLDAAALFLHARRLQGASDSSSS